MDAMVNGFWDSMYPPLKRAARAPVCSCGSGSLWKRCSLRARCRPPTSMPSKRWKRWYGARWALDRTPRRLEPGRSVDSSVVREKGARASRAGAASAAKVEEAPPPAATTNGTMERRWPRPCRCKPRRWPRRRRRSRRLRRSRGRIARGAARQVRAVARGARRPGARGACNRARDPWGYRLLRTAAWMTYDTPPEVTAGRRTRADHRRNFRR